MQSRQRFSQLLVEVDQDISRYINRIDCTVVPANNEYALNSERDKLKGVREQGFAKDETINQAVFVKNRHDAELTAKRIVNLLRLKNAISNYTKHVADLYGKRALDDQTIGSMLEGLESDIATATEKNNALNSEYKKEFRTYHQGRIDGLGIFCSWYQKSWVQPKSMHVLEHAAARVGKYIKEFSRQHPEVRIA